MKITYQTGLIPDTKDIVEVYRSSGIKRPVEDLARIANMYTNSNLIVTAWAGNKLVGISRSITDFYYCCYLSDLAVRKEYQKTGIGSELIALTRERIGDQVALILVSAPEAIDYYPKVGFDKINNGYMIKRSK
ncbi:GNAT family N-acetyltransferase [Parapedobacter sp. SGR-10]|jgi:GNAT superfamily N-acetyltransferase|uniref:GNAT family N-acetyltransferase n=1 Tax=Parapedobacter sp. SGR-10 TaxID=2710879 RepID=UPI0013D27B1B|nr:GNAT family N-acetyltransferase [Parapedobacter sp. SGR-10]NGF58267.1 GNAT family N-acetyltransferase [Parapedobacter sp. SGR-10]